MPNIWKYTIKKPHMPIKVIPFSMRCKQDRTKQYLNQDQEILSRLLNAI